ETVAGANTVIGASGDGVGASGVVLTNVDGDLAFTDLDIFADGGAVAVTGTGAVNTGAGSGMRFTVSTGVATFSANTGPALSLDNLTADVQNATLTSSATLTTGVSVNNV